MQCLPWNYLPLSPSFPVILDDTNAVVIPMDFNRDDLEYLVSYLELYVKQRERKPESLKRLP